MDADELDDASRLCLACGLCCDGAVFSWAVLADGDDRAALEAAGAEVRDTADGPALTIPCGALRGTCCSIYDRRPDVCRGFRCRLLRRLDAGRIDLSHALRVVARTKGVCAEVESGVGPELAGAWSRGAADFLRSLDSADEPESARTASAPVLLAIAEMRTLLQREFVARRERP